MISCFVKGLSPDESVVLNNAIARTKGAHLRMTVFDIDSIRDADVLFGLFKVCGLTILRAYKWLDEAVECCKQKNSAKFCFLGETAENGGIIPFTEVTENLVSRFETGVYTEDDFYGAGIYTKEEVSLFASQSKETLYTILVKMMCGTRLDNQELATHLTSLAELSGNDISFSTTSQFGLFVNEQLLIHEELTVSTIAEAVQQFDSGDKFICFENLNRITTTSDLRDIIEKIIADTPQDIVSQYLTMLEA